MWRYTPKLKKAKTKQNFEKRIPKEWDVFKVLKLSMQDNQEVKSFLVSDYLIYKVKQIFPLCCFMSTLQCYIERLV